MNEHQADKALRGLFQQTGALSAPEGLDARILQRIAVMPKPVAAPQQPLLPKWTWLISTTLALGIALYPGFKFSVPRLGRIPSFDWKPFLDSPWLMMGVCACVALLGLDAWLNRERALREAR
jgi:hypothetical protein